MEDPWHNWYMPEEASGTEAFSMAQWSDQQHPLCPMASVVVAEPYPAEPKLLVPVDPEEGAIVTEVVIKEALEHTIRGGVVVVAVALDMVKYYKESSKI